MRVLALIFAISQFCIWSCNSQSKVVKETVSNDYTFPITKTDQEWRKQLNDMEYHVIREKGTERAFTGEYWDNKRDGVYQCRACGQPLYDSQTKFKSGTGWPSFYAPITDNDIYTDTDYNLGYARSEIMCARCGGHLGHVFDDGPMPTGKRHCVNSVSLQFIPKDHIVK